MDRTHSTIGCFDKLYCTRKSGWEYNERLRIGMLEKPKEGSCGNEEGRE